MSRGEDMRSAEFPPPAEYPEDITAIIVIRSFEEDDESSPGKDLFINIYIIKFDLHIKTYNLTRTFSKK